MKRMWLFAAVLFLAGGTITAQAPKPAEIVDPTATTWTLEKLDNPPAREIKFEKLDTEFPMRLSRPDPKLLEQKYVAIVRLSQPTGLPGFVRVSFGASDPFLEIGKFGSRAGDSDGVLSQLQYLGGKLLISGARRLNGDSLQASMERFVAQIPKDRLPADKLVAHFNSPDIDQGYLRILETSERNSGEPKSPFTEVQVLAPTPEVAEERTTALLQLLDQGGFRAIQLGVFKHRETLVTQWRGARKSEAELDAQLAELNEKIATFADFTADMLTGLRLQQLQLDVNLAGAKARLATCDALLKDDLPAANRTKVEEVKLATAIEVAGIEASRLKSAELIKMVKAKNELQTQQVEATNSRSKARSKLQSLADSLKLADAILAQNAPMPLVDGKVLVQPIKWTP